MKKSLKLSLVAVSLFVSAAIAFVSCNKEHFIKDLDEAKKAKTNQKVALPKGVTATCNCASIPTGCPNKFKKCADKMLNGNASRDFVINWTSATACGSTLPPPTYGRMCYTGSCDEFYLQLTSDIPLCLYNCYKEPYCVKATSVSFSTGCAFSLQYTSDDGSQVITISGDPHISIQCSPGSGLAATADGDLTWL
jgi:hypothetical protein